MSDTEKLPKSIQELYRQKNEYRKMWREQTNISIDLMAKIEKDKQKREELKNLVDKMLGQGPGSRIDLLVLLQQIDSFLDTNYEKTIVNRPNPTPEPTSGRPIRNKS
jgi:hypothetical protein